VRLAKVVYRLRLLSTFLSTLSACTMSSSWLALLSFVPGMLLSLLLSLPFALVFAVCRCLLFCLCLCLFL
jgi:hypothetical protein